MTRGKIYLPRLGLNPLASGIDNWRAPQGSLEPPTEETETVPYSKCARWTHGDSETYSDTVRDNPVSPDLGKPPVNDGEHVKRITESVKYDALGNLIRKETN